MEVRQVFASIYLLVLLIEYMIVGTCNLPPVFTQDMNNLALSEDTPVGTIVYRLEGFDPEGSDVMYGLIGTNNFMVDSNTGDVTVVKPLDREVQNILLYDFQFLTLLLK